MTSILEPFFDDIIRFLPKIPWIIVGLVFGAIAIRIATYILRMFVRVAKVPNDFRGLIISVFRLVSWVILLFIISQSLGFGSLALAISGSAVLLVFLLSSTIGPFLGNIVTGIFLIGDPDFGVGMRVKTNDGKTEGIIKGIDMRKVRLLDDKGKLHIIPNSIVENTEWIVIERKVGKKKNG